MNTTDHVVSWWLSHPECWFNSTPATDLIVIENLGKYITDESEYDSLTLLGKLIVDDQISRHYYRQLPHDDPFLKIYHDQRALALSAELIPFALESSIYTPEEICFILMPLRHSEIEENRVKAIDIIKVLMSRQETSVPIYERFLRAALIRVRNPTRINFENKRLPIEIICPSFTWTQFGRFPLPSDILNAISRIPRRHNEEYDCVVSISGGSDSMLVLYAVCMYGLRPIALMIDYGNRSEHEDELYLVDCMTSQLKVPYYVRSIKEIKRVHSSAQNEETDSLSTMRTFYESVTREIRFSAYKYFGLPVLLGHNWDDCFENCITNMISGRSPENLLGMSFYGVDSGVEIYRPFLEIKKSRIVELCNQFGIPYLVDSTPKWSRRGQIRDNIRPVVDAFDPHLAEKIVDHCLEKSNLVKEYKELVDYYPFIEFGDSHYTFRIPTIRSILFWRLIVDRISTLLHDSHVKIKSIEYLIETIDKPKHSPRKITLSPTLTAIFNTTENTIQIIKVDKVHKN